MWVMTNSNPMAYNEPGRPRKVDFVEKTVGKISKMIMVPPLSATLYSLDVK
jgi:hypothetical protein